MKRFFVLLLIIILGSFFCACADQGIQGEKGDQGIQGEKGEQGIQGEKGEQGIQGEKGEQGIQGEKGEQGIQGEKGEQGIQGESGEDGNIPYIGENGNWFIGTIDTGYPSRGEDGVSSRISINEEGYWMIDGVVTAYRAQGACDHLIQVCMPEEYVLAVNDNFQLFYRGVVQAVEPYHYAIEIHCPKGKIYSRYFEWTPTEEDVGSFTLTLSVYDDNGKKLGSDTTVLRVYKPSSTSDDTKNILCIGDSLTESGRWVAEAARRFTKTGGEIAGLGLDYLNFVGSMEKTIDSTTVRYEGHGGWSWKTYCSEISPFYDAEKGAISFRSYCQKNNIETLDVVYIFLSWNGFSQAYQTEFDTDFGPLFYARKLIDCLHEEYPDAIVRCMGIQMPSQNGGMGYNYSADKAYSSTYGMLVSAMNYNVALEKLCLSNEYADFVKYVDIAGQFDSDYNMPSTSKPVNNRNNQQEVIGNNGVHPTVNGYYQIGDAVFRSLCEVFG